MNHLCPINVSMLIVFVPPIRFTLTRNYFFFITEFWFPSVYFRHGFHNLVYWLTMSFIKTYSFTWAWFHGFLAIEIKKMSIPLLDTIYFVYKPNYMILHFVFLVFNTFSIKGYILIFWLFGGQLWKIIVTTIGEINTNKKHHHPL